MRNLGRLMNKKFSPFILIAISFLIAFITSIFQYFDDKQYGDVHLSDLWGYGLIFIGFFSMTQILFMALGFIGKKLFGGQRHRENYVIYPLNNILLFLNMFLSTLISLGLITSHISSTGYAEMTLAEHVVDISFWITAFGWFSIPYIILFYCEIIFIFIFKKSRKIVGVNTYPKT